jgi:hypothetical protein
MDFFFWRDLFFAAKKAVIRFGCVEARSLKPAQTHCRQDDPKIQSLLLSI